MNIKRAIYNKTLFIRHTYKCLSCGFPLRIIVLCYIPDLHKYPRTTHFGHPFGIVIRGGTKIGEHCTFRQGTTIGQRTDENEPATIGDNVNFGANALVLGNVRIGDNCSIGAGAIVLADVPKNTTVMGVWK